MKGNRKTHPKDAERKSRGIKKKYIVKIKGRLFKKQW